VLRETGFLFLSMTKTLVGSIPSVIKNHHAYLDIIFLVHILFLFTDILSIEKGEMAKIEITTIRLIKYKSLFKNAYVNPVMSLPQFHLLEK
jgi:1-acyl-sn-glycerol-3-phosphate acyltransferase